MLPSVYPVLSRWAVFLALAVCAAPGRPAEAASGAGDGKHRYISARAYYQAMRAEVLTARGDLPGAREALKLALVYDPDSYFLSVRLASVCLSLIRTSADPSGELLDEAERFASRATRLAPRRAAGWRARGHVDQALGRNDRAERALRRAMAVEPETGEAVAAARDLADLLGASGRSAEVIAAIGRSFVQRGRLLQGAALLERAAQLAPEDARVLGWLDDARAELVRSRGRR